MAKILTPLPITNQPLGMLWDLLIGLLVFLSGMAVPIALAVNAPDLGLLLWPLAVFFALDALVSLRRRSRPGSPSPGDLFRPDHPISPRALWIDLLAALSLLLLALWIALPRLAPAYLVVAISLLPLFKLLKLNRLSAALQEDLNLNPSILRLVFFLFWILLGAHLIALGWILIGGVTPGLSPQRTYTIALYWAVTTLSTVGYGDITPDQGAPLQLVFTMVVMLLGVGMYGYIIGNVATLITKLDAARAAYLEKMEEINLFLKTRDIPAQLQERVRSYYRYLWETHKTITTRALLDELPHTLSIDLALFLNRDILTQVPFFTGASGLFIREIVQVLEPMVFLPGDTIIHQGEYGDSMYFLSSGQTEVLIDGQVVDRHGAGTFFGEGSLLTNERRNASIRTTTYCEVYRLSRESFDDLRRRYPRFDRHVTDVFSTRETPK